MTDTEMVGTIDAVAKTLRLVSRWGLGDAVDLGAVAESVERLPTALGDPGDSVLERLTP